MSSSHIAFKEDKETKLKGILDLDLDPVVQRIMEEWTQLRHLAAKKISIPLTPSELSILQGVTDRFFKEYGDLKEVNPYELYYIMVGSLILKSKLGVQITFPYYLLLWEYCASLYQNVVDWLVSQVSRVSLDFFIEKVARMMRDAIIPMKRTDVRILRLLTLPSRITRTKLGYPTNLEIAGRLNVSKTTMERRMNRLVMTNSIIPFALVNPGVLGFTTVGFYHTRSLNPQEEACRVVNIPLPRSYAEERFSILHLPPDSEYWINNHVDNIIKFTGRSYAWNLTQLEPTTHESWHTPPSWVTSGTVVEPSGILQDLTPSESPLSLSQFDALLLDRLQIQGVDRMEDMALDIKVARTYLYNRFRRLQKNGCFELLVGLYHFSRLGHFIFYFKSSSKDLLRRTFEFISLFPFSTAFLAEEMLVAMIYLPSKWLLDLLDLVRDLNQLDGVEAWTELLDFKRMRWKFPLNLPEIWKGAAFSPDFKNKDDSLEVETDPQFSWKSLK